MTAIPFKARSAKPLRNGDASMVVHVSKEFTPELLKYFNKPDAEGAMVRLAEQYKHQSVLLWHSEFFHTTEVLTKIGSDRLFLEWLRQQPCAKTGNLGYESDPVIVAHVRRIASGAGTGIKPIYSAIPLLNSLHLLQHQKGESAVAPQEWWELQAKRYRHLWGWETLKTKLGYTSWIDVPPATLIEWAKARGVERYLPAGYE